MLAAGTRVGPYEVVSWLGAGGMGEVYRARDTKLPREVALKTLPEDLARQPDRLARLRSEARILATLNHPGIAMLHGLEEADGGVPVLVMELVDGETLADLLRRKPLPVREATAIGQQIAVALEAAHQKGVLHRDLKPANIRLTADGRVKLLDFGLAKAVIGAAIDSHLDTHTSPASEAGVVLGTAPYMSTEQARGQEVDRRTDVWSFGCVLFEMLAGKRAFEGATFSDTVAAVLEREPDWKALPRETPRTLLRLMQRCLQKEKDRRLRDIGDARLELEDVLSGADGTETGGVDSERHGPARWLLLGACAVALVAMTMLWVQYRRAKLHHRLPTIQRLTFNLGHISDARFTSDGKTVVYSAFWDGNPPEIFSTRLERHESRSLGLPSARLTSVSSQGELAILLSRDFASNSPGRLARVPFSGGTPREVLDDVVSADWSPDGRELAVTRLVDGELQLEYPIGKVLAHPPHGVGTIRVSPDGGKVAMLGASEIVIYDRGGKKTVVDAPRSVIGHAWASDDAMWITAGETGENRSIRLVTLDGKARELYRAPTSMVMLDAAPDGRILFYQGFERMAVRGKAPGDPKERELGVFAWSELSGLSRGGTHVTMGTPTNQPQRDTGATYFRSTRGDAPVRLTEADAIALSPDARWALVSEASEGRSRLQLMPTGAGEARVLPLEPLQDVGGAWFMDDEHILVDGAEPGRPERSYLLDRSGKAPRAVTPEGVIAIQYSNARDSILGCCAKGRVVVRCPLSGGSPEPLPARLPSNVSPIGMTADGRSLFVHHPSVPLRVDRFELATGRLTPWKALRPDDLTGVTLIWNVAVTPDGEAYAYQYSRFLKDLFLIEGLRQN
jgi:eukaryotic-like serine/threonine-protein kinase